MKFNAVSYTHLDVYKRQELMFAFGGAMVMLNGFHFENPKEANGMQGLSLKELKALVSQKPVGIYMGCPKADDEELALDPKKVEMRSMTVSYTHLDVYKRQDIYNDRCILKER